MQIFDLKVHVCLANSGIQKPLFAILAGYARCRERLGKLLGMPTITLPLTAFCTASMRYFSHNSRIESALVCYLSHDSTKSCLTQKLFFVRKVAQRSNAEGCKWKGDRWHSQQLA